MEKIYIITLNNCIEVNGLYNFINSPNLVFFSLHLMNYAVKSKQTNEKEKNNKNFMDLYKLDE